MSQTVGTVHGQELWLRCPECGDSQHHPNKGHLSINLAKSVFHCVRCGYGGQLSSKQMLELVIRYDVGSLQAPQPHTQVATSPEPGANRYSALKRQRHTDDDGVIWDVFEVRDPVHNERVGQYLRHEKTSLIFGESGLGYVGDTLISSPSRPLRLVEGPYDVLDRQDVCCYGFLGSRHLTMLRGHFVVLCPDGDVWQDDLLRRRMMSLLRWSINSPQAPTVLGLEMIPDGLDPDECHPTDRLYVERATLLRKITTSVRRSSIDLARYMS